MTDYGQELLPPEYRNLVINPGGEPSSLAGSYYASNGAVRAGVTVAEGAPNPVAGTGVVEYRVSATTSESYFFAPLGPLEPTHRGSFKIPEAGTVSVAVKLRASATVWVEIQARWYAEIWTGAEVTGVSEIGRTSVLEATSISNSGWSSLNTFVTDSDVMEGATHWCPIITVYADDPATNSDAPVIGTKVWADQFFVPDSGADLAGVPYGDGSLPGWEWEGAPFGSSSRTSETQPEEPDATEEESTGDDAYTEEPDPDNTDEDPEAPVAPLPVPEPPAAPAAELDDPGYQSADARPAYRVAEDVIGWRREARHVHLHEDVQLEGLVMNRMDEQGVVWLVSDIEGWWTTPEPEVPDVSRGWFDGSYETRGRYTARTFTITGSFVPRHPGDVAPARDTLIRALNLVHRGGWFMTHEDPEGKTRTKGSKVWLAGAPMIQTTGLNGKTDFSIALRAPNPVKQSIKDGIPPGYNEMTLVTSSSQYPEREYPRQYPWAYPEAIFGATVAQVVNDGNAVVWPILRLAGPTNGAVKVYNVDTDQEFRIVRKLYPGEVLEIDCFTKQVTLNGTGNHRFYLDVDVDWLMLQPGPNKLYFVEETIGSIKTELKVLWRSGWIG